MKLKTLILFEKYLHKLNKRSFRFGEDNNQDICSICLENFNGVPQNEICINQCGHKFHCVCIQGWVNSNINTKCPLCRKDITVVRPNNIPDDSGYETDPEYGSTTFPRINLIDQFNRAANNRGGLRRSYTYQE